MDDSKRFSVVVLEKDVLEYNYYKTQYHNMEQMLKSWRGKFFRNHYTSQKMYFYNKYIMKMKYLEDHYRKTNVYTDYHRQLEGENQDPVIATAIQPTAPDYNF